MATEVRTITDTWCDVHLLGGENERVAATWGEDITIGSLRRRLDLCDDHLKELIGNLPEMLESCGTKLDPKGASQSARAGAHICPRCQLEFATRSALTAHARNVHKQPLPVLEREAGLAPSGSTTRSKLLTCDICGNQFMGPQGLGAHKRTVHNIRSSKATG